MTLYVTEIIYNILDILMNIELSWCDTDREVYMYAEKSQFQSHFVCHKPCVDWENKLSDREAGDQPPPAVLSKCYESRNFNNGF